MPQPVKRTLQVQSSKCRKALSWPYTGHEPTCNIWPPGPGFQDHGLTTETCQMKHHQVTAASQQGVRLHLVSLSNQKHLETGKLSPMSYLILNRPKCRDIGSKQRKSSRICQGHWPSAENNVQAAEVISCKAGQNLQELWAKWIQGYSL